MISLEALIWIALKVVAVYVIFEVVLVFLIWRVRGINRAMERRRREGIKKRRAARELIRNQAHFQAMKRAYEEGRISANDIRETVELPRIPRQKTREQLQEELEYRAHA